MVARRTDRKRTTVIFEFSKRGGDVKFRCIPSMVFCSLLMVVVAASGCSTASGAEADEQADEEQVLGERERRPPMDRPMSREEMMQACPMQLDGASMSMELLDGAVAIDFTTEEDVEELRGRVESMVERHNQRMEEGPSMHRGEGRMHRGEDDDHRRMHTEMMSMMADAEAETEEINRGMRMRLVPEDPEDAQELYDAMQQRMQEGRQQSSCPMMQMMEGQQMPRQPEE